MISAFSVEQIRQAEAPALAAGVPLMETAAHGLADVITDVLSNSSPAAAAEAQRPAPPHGEDLHTASHQHPASSGVEILVLIGGGNNGGDGLFAASYLALAGYQVGAVLAHPRPHEAGLAAAVEAGVHMWRVGEHIHQEQIEYAAVTSKIWVDALAGIGITGELRGEARLLIEWLIQLRNRRRADAVVVAVDIPSGLHADHSLISGPVLPADHTVTFGAVKPALLLPPAAGLMGQVHLVQLPIEFPARPVVRRLELTDVAQLLPPPQPSDHKYSRGVVEIHAGSTEYPGAGVLCCAGALRSGAGMVRYRGAARDLVLHSWPEVVTVPGRYDALVVGPGGMVDDDTHQQLDHALAQGIPVIADAAGMEAVPRIQGASRPILLTPHAGELAKLLGWQVGEVTADLAVAAQEAAVKIGAAVLAKGSITVIASPQGDLYSQADGTSWLATAGSGDVLAGIAGTVAAQLRPENVQEMAQVGAVAALIHGYAGRFAAGQWPTGGGHPMIASDIAANVPHVFRTLYSS